MISWANQPKLCPNSRKILKKHLSMFNTAPWPNVTDPVNVHESHGRLNIIRFIIHLFFLSPQPSSLTHNGRQFTHPSWLRQAYGFLYNNTRLLRNNSSGLERSWVFSALHIFSSWNFEHLLRYCDYSMLCAPAGPHRRGIRDNIIRFGRRGRGKGVVIKLIDEPKAGKSPFLVSRNF